MGVFAATTLGSATFPRRPHSSVTTISLYSEAELKPWVERIHAVAAESPVTFVITNNHYRGKGVVNALQLGQLLTGAKVQAPELLVDEYPVLKAIRAS